MTQILTRKVSPEPLSIGKIHLATIQSVLILVTTAVYYFNNVQINFIDSGYQLLAALVFAAAIGIFLILPLSQGETPKLGYLLLALSVAFLVFGYDSVSHAQILQGADDAIGDVGTAAGDTFAAEVLEAFVSLVRLVLFLAVVGAVVAAVIFGVTQGQWQAPVLVVAVIALVGLFVEIMGAVVFG